MDWIWSIKIVLTVSISFLIILCTTSFKLSFHLQLLYVSKLSLLVKVSKFHSWILAKTINRFSTVAFYWSVMLILFRMASNSATFRHWALFSGCNQHESSTIFLSSSGDTLTAKCPSIHTQLFLHENVLLYSGRNVPNNSFKLGVSYFLVPTGCECIQSVFRFHKGIVLYKISWTTPSLYMSVHALVVRLSKDPRQKHWTSSSTIFSISVCKCWHELCMHQHIHLIHDYPTWGVSSHCSFALKLLMELSLLEEQDLSLAKVLATCYPATPAICISTCLWHVILGGYLIFWWVALQPLP